MMRVLVTGANGFIGSHLCEYLLKKGYEVRGMIRKTSDRRWIEGLKIKLLFGDLNDAASIKEALKGVEAVFHTAAVVRAGKRSDFIRVISQGTKTLAGLAMEAGVKRFVLFSSCAAVGPARAGEVLNDKKEPRPVSDYGRAKLAAERAVLRLKERMVVVVLRFPAVYGPRDRDGLLLWRALNRGWVPMLGKEFSLIYVADAVKAAALALEKDILSGSVYFISDGVCYSYERIAEEWRKFTGKKVRLVRIPFWLGLISARLNAWLKREPTIFNPDKVRELCQDRWVCSLEKAKIELGFEPEYNLSRGGAITVSWYKEKGWL
ncbi:MAG: NAD-dependent epimerase/dehydratase family protein [bacterium]